ncbi:L,D-transpeptidase family protein [Pedobacter sp. Du54]|uniref:L,D-transpeptidase family protein n=1 Tax=Pedobacter anseongensis TaxID=3133439 RepID=UPI0030A742B4
MPRFLFPFLVFVAFFINANAQVLDSVRIKTPKIDTLILITQQDINDYISLRKITDTLGKQVSYARILKNTKQSLVLNKNISYEHALSFSEQTDQIRVVYNTIITEADVTEYLSIRKIIGDTTGKTNDYLKIIKAAKMRVANGKSLRGLYKEIDYETALKEAEENTRLRSMVDKVLVIKSERKMYLQKQGKTIRSYHIGLGPNPVGQKEREGDGRTPEGIYKIDYQKWDSPTFHSFHLSYPNEIDLARAKAKSLTAGSNIMIHGTSKGVKKKKDWTNGCIALNNTDMSEFRKIVFLETIVEIKK